MARGWGANEEDLGAQKEEAREERESERTSRAQRVASAEIARRRGLELSLARIEELLSRTENADRRRALETAKAELL